MPLICEIKLSKESGLTVLVENPDAGITQTVTMDGTTLKMSVKSDQETTTWLKAMEWVHTNKDERGSGGRMSTHSGPAPSISTRSSSLRSS